MDTVIKVFESLVKLNNYEVERFDLQAYDYGNGIAGYVGIMYIKGMKKTLIIHHNGSFDWSEREA